MRRSLLPTATAVAILAGSLWQGPAYAKSPPRPAVTARSSVVIPSYACQSAAKWVKTIYSPGSRIDSSEVVSVRKRGYTFPVSHYRVCGYMGSGTYTVKVRVRWSVSRWRSKWRWDGYQELVDVPFTCSLDRPPDPPDYESVYVCAYDDGREWNDEYEYTTDPDATGFERYYWVNNLLNGCDHTGLSGNYDWAYLWINPQDWSLGPACSQVWPQTLTGGTREPEWIEYRYKKRVRQWVKKPTFTVSRVVQVTVR